MLSIDQGRSKFRSTLIFNMLSMAFGPEVCSSEEQNPYFNNLDPPRLSFRQIQRDHPKPQSRSHRAAAFCMSAGTARRTIRRREDGYFNATDMCQACGKQFNDWARLDSTKKFLSALSAKTGIPVKSEIKGLIESKKGGNGEPGSWIHPRVAIALAMWCEPEFHVFVVGLQKVRNLPPAGGSHIQTSC
jgi:hypothetical protein